MDVLLANPRGFCAGVDRAIAIVEQALAQFGAPIYVRHEVVHNKFVVDELRAEGAVFVDELDDVPHGAIVVFSAHGVSKAVRAEAEARGLRIFDATCPLVTKVHVEIGQMHARGLEIVMIGHAGHPEVEGTLGQCDGGVYLVESVADVARLTVKDPARLAYVTQTTLSVDDAAAVVEALKARFPTIVGPRRDDICYATQNRQDAVKALTGSVDVVIVVGSPNSSNSNRLREVAANRGIPAYMIDRADELRPEWIAGKARVGVTAGASAPEVLVRQVIDNLRALVRRTLRSCPAWSRRSSFRCRAGCRGWRQRSRPKSAPARERRSIPAGCRGVARPPCAASRRREHLPRSGAGKRRYRVGAETGGADAPPRPRRLRRRLVHRLQDPRTQLPQARERQPAGIALRARARQRGRQRDHAEFHDRRALRHPAAEGRAGARRARKRRAAGLQPEEW
jgi:4-hydroxy-3-methylbut-2-enyl diphosphate reductase